MSHVTRRQSSRFEATPYRRTEQESPIRDHLLEPTRVVLVQSLSPWAKMPFSFHTDHRELINVRVVRSYYLYLAEGTVCDMIDCFLWSQSVQGRVYYDRNQFAVDHNYSVASVAVRFGQFCGRE